MTITLNSGTNFSLKQIERFIALNDEYDEVKIASVFGSLRSDVLDLKSARPDFRLANTDLSTFENYVKVATAHGIEVEYAVNATLYSSVEELHSGRTLLIDKLKYLEGVGVKRIIVSNPIIMEIASQNTSLKIKASTILGINKPNALKYYADYGVDNVCPDIYVNRDIPTLAAMQKEGAKYGMEMELLANEVCMYGDVPCSNMLRNACYQHSSMGGNEGKLFDNWPFDRCQAEREKRPICWLKIPYILPQHLKKYAELTGITRYKISGRTNSQEYLFVILERYMRQSFDGDIVELFMLPQNTTSNAAKRVSVSELEGVGFFNKWLNGGSCNYNCHACKHCDGIYEKL